MAENLHNFVSYLQFSREIESLVVQYILVKKFSNAKMVLSESFNHVPAFGE